MHKFRLEHQVAVAGQPLQEGRCSCGSRPAGALPGSQGVGLAHLCRTCACRSRARGRCSSDVSTSCRAAARRLPAAQRPAAGVAQAVCSQTMYTWLPALSAKFAELHGASRGHLKSAPTCSGTSLPPTQLRAPLVAASCWGGTGRMLRGSPAASDAWPCSPVPTASAPLPTVELLPAGPLLWLPAACRLHCTCHCAASLRGWVNEAAPAPRSAATGRPPSLEMSSLAGVPRSAASSTSCCAAKSPRSLAALSSAALAACSCCCSA